MSLNLYLTFVLASFVIVVVPGPSVTVIVANSLRHGFQAGLMNIAGTQLGLAVILAILAAGLSSLVATMGWWFDWVRLAGAAYLIYLGIKLMRGSGEISGSDNISPANGNFIWQGFMACD